MAAATGSLACARGRVHTRACTPSCHVMLAAIWATIAGTRLTIGPLGGACQAASHSAATRCALSLTAILFLSRVALPCCRSSSHWSGRHAANLCISVPPIAVPHHRSPHHHCRIIAVPPSQSPLPPRPSCPPPPPPSPPAPLPASPPLSPPAPAPPRAAPPPARAAAPAPARTWDACVCGSWARGGGEKARVGFLCEVWGTAPLEYQMPC